MAVASPRKNVTQRGAYFTLDLGQSLEEQIRQIATYLQSMRFESSILLPQYTVSTVPNAADHTAGLVYVTDETGGAVPAFSDGSDWRRVTDRVVVS